MEALKEKVIEIMVNQNHILEAVKYLHEKLEEVTENRNSDKSDVKNIIEGQAMVDGIIVKNSDDIKVLVKTKQDNVAMIQRIETRIARMDEEIESIRISTWSEISSEAKIRPPPHYCPQQPYYQNPSAVGTNHRHVPFIILSYPCP